MDLLEYFRPQICKWNFDDMTVIDNGKGTVIKIGEKEKDWYDRKKR